MKKKPTPIQLWRSGWRTDVFKIRNGVLFETPSMPPVDLSFRKTLLEEDGIYFLTDERLTQIEKTNKWWADIGEPKWILAPMVAQSERCFRVLCREEGVDLCFTPMYLAERVNSGVHDSELQIRKNADAHPHVDCDSGMKRLNSVVKIKFDEAQEGKKSIDYENQNMQDRPLVCQLAGNDIESMVQAGLRVQGVVDAVDLNFGCPQICAENALFGAFFLESKPDVALSMVTACAQALSVPVWVKMRMHPRGTEATVRMALKLQQAGASVLTLHGRRRWQREHEGPADWSVIREVKAALRIPVIANGSVQCLSDAHACMAYTGVDAVMSGTGLLRHPNLFSDATLRSPTAPHIQCDGTVEMGYVEQEKRSAVYKALMNCYRYLEIVEKCSTGVIADADTTVEAAASNGRSGGEVVSMHLMAMLQIHIMYEEKYRSLCSRLLNKAYFTVTLFRETLGMIATTLLGNIDACNQCDKGTKCPPPVATKFDDLLSSERKELNPCRLCVYRMM